MNPPVFIFYSQQFPKIITIIVTIITIIITIKVAQLEFSTCFFKRCT